MRKEEHEEIYDLGFKVGVKARPHKGLREKFILMSSNYNYKQLMESLTEFLICNECPIPEFFIEDSSTKDIGRKLVVYLMGIQNGTLYNK